VGDWLRLEICLKYSSVVSDELDEPRDRAKGSHGPVRRYDPGQTWGTRHARAVTCTASDRSGSRQILSRVKSLGPRLLEVARAGGGSPTALSMAR
jgi:hypothetical protein